MLKNAPLLILDEVSSALDADRILVLEQGEILNEGTHDMLISDRKSVVFGNCVFVRCGRLI